jgi:beta-glucosidase
MDNECAIESLFDRNSFGQAANYLNAVKSGKLAVADLDQAVIRGLVARIKLGLLDNQPSPNLKTGAINSANDRALALTAAEQSLVLLKNDGVLPLDRKGVKIAVIGPLANSRRVLRGNYTNRDTAELPSVLDGLKLAMPDAKVTYVPSGASITDGDVIPPSALQTIDGKPGVTVRFYPFKPDGSSAPKTLAEKFARVSVSTPAAVPTVIRIEPFVNFELFNQPALPEGGKAVASGYLVPPVSGTYRVGARTTGGTFQFDNLPQVDIRNDFNPSVMPVLQTVELQAGKRYPFVLSMSVPVQHFGELDWQRISNQPERDVAAVSQDADVIVAVVGINSTLESEESSIKLPGFNGGDRTTLDLPADQLKLLAAAKATGKPLVVVNMSGSAINLEWAKKGANAIIQAWYPGEAGGVAVGRVIAGLANPGGRLPVTFYWDIAQLPPFEDYAMAGRTYRYFSGEPVYGFGYGLSYTKFAYGPVTITPRDGNADKGIFIETTLTNTGKRPGEEVAQVYLRFPDVPGIPRIALRGFERIQLAPRETRKLRLWLSPRDLGTVSPEGNGRVLAGRYQAFVGGGQPDSGLPGKWSAFTVNDTVKLPD